MERTKTRNECKAEVRAIGKLFFVQQKTLEKNVNIIPSFDEMRKLLDEIRIDPSHRTEIIDDWGIKKQTGPTLRDTAKLMDAVLTCMERTHHRSDCREELRPLDTLFFEQHKRIVSRNETNKTIDLNSVFGKNRTLSDTEYEQLKEQIGKEYEKSRPFYQRAFHKTGEFLYTYANKVVDFTYKLIDQLEERINKK
jgi:hypothetical protein